jgi:hypothetical protein
LIDLSDLIEGVIGHFLEDHIDIVDLANLNLLESEKIHSEDIHISLEFLNSLLKMLEIELLIQGVESLRDEVVLESLNPNHQIFLEFILPFHEGLLSAIHTFNDVDLLGHGFLKLLHPL